MKILQTSSIIDFYINKRKYNSYKTKRGKWNYIYRELNEIFKSLAKTTVDGVEIRDVSTTSNNFWGQDHISFINDIGYNHDNRLPLREDKLTIRYFDVDIIAVLLEEKDTSDCFLTLKDDNFEIITSSIKIV